MQAFTNTQQIDFSSNPLVQLPTDFKIEDTYIDSIINLFDIDLTDLDIEGGAE